MRICLLTPELAPFVAGGIGRYVADLAAALHRRGNEITVSGVRIHQEPHLMHQWGTSTSVNDTHSSFLTTLTGYVPGAWRLRKSYHRLMRTRRRFQRTQRDARLLANWVMANEARFDVIEIPNWPGHGAYIRPKHAPFVVRLSSPAVECAKDGGVLTYLEALSCRNADLVIGNSQAVVDKVHHLYSLDCKNISIIPHGLPDAPRIFAPSNRGRIQIVYIGRCEVRKGTDIFIKALSTVLPQCPGLSITFIGFTEDAVTMAFPELTNVWTDLRRQCPNTVRCLGKVSEGDKQKVLQTSHWVAIPSRFESFGLVAVEGMRAGTPIVTSGGGGLLEVVSQSATSLILGENTITEWSRALHRIADEGIEGALARRQDARDTYENHFTIERMAIQTERAYQQLLDSRSLSNERGEPAVFLPGAPSPLGDYLSH